ncbi:MAG TPA: DUF362 domain-containing protein [Nitrospirota bacterium]|nr:DUF362 domain-containing protein [Nitrospirota bacterium]
MSADRDEPNAQNVSGAVALVRCSDYGRNAVEQAVRKAVDHLGGMQSFVRPGDLVLLKPNLLKARTPEAAVTTHPEVVRTAIRLVREAGGRAVVGDSPGMGDLKKVAEKAGILDVVHEEGADLVDFTEAVPVKNTGRFQRFEVARIACDADVIINLPKLKTHGMTTITGAVKNLFGCIPGKRKVQWHFSTGVNHELFMQMLVELYALLRPQLTIMDAVVGMEGNGPGSGDPRVVGVILAGSDAVAVDAVASHLVGVPLQRHPVLQAAKRSGIGEVRITAIEIIGASIDDIEIVPFRLPPASHLEWPLPEWTRKSLKNAFTSKPHIDQSICIACGICQQHCPQQAIHGNHRGLTVDYRICIRCFCCQEFCPQGAVTVKKGWALTFLR